MKAHIILFAESSRVDVGDVDVLLDVEDVENKCLVAFLVRG